MEFSMLRSISVLLVFIGLSQGATAQPPPTAPDPAKPGAATTSPAPYVLIMPPGFEKVTVAGHTALCEPNDREWVKKTLEQIKPATRPTTMPADLLARTKANK